MAHLKELSITFPVALPHFWNCITAPRVEQLEITTMYDGPEDWGTEELLAFRERSGFTLRALALRMDLSDFPEDVVRFLQVVQEVEVLTLRWTGPQEEPDPHVSRLVREFAAATWCPNLHTLTIDATPETAAVLVSRCASQVAKGAVVQLRNITLAAEVEPQDLPAVFPREVNELRALGCNVTVEVMTFFGGEHFVGHGYQDQLAAFHAHGQWPGRDDDAEDDEDDEDESDESDTESDEIGKDGDEGDDGTTLDVEGQTS
ncbi:hypothetical protein C8R46DRAFT_1196787 [Mycena filopes]|nr:hypothetical protein C8R46DRAFT_1196787 [Mycena filopes]